VLDDGELVDGEPVVVAGVVEVEEPGFVAADAAVLARHLNVHALDDHAVQAAVLLDERGGFRLVDLLGVVSENGKNRTLSLSRLERP
jgi:hypothetical protein